MLPTYVFDFPFMFFIYLENIPVEGKIFLIYLQNAVRNFRMRRPKYV